MYTPELLYSYRVITMIENAVQELHDASALFRVELRFLRTNVCHKSNFVVCNCRSQSVRYYIIGARARYN